MTEPMLGALVARAIHRAKLAPGSPLIQGFVRAMLGVERDIAADAIEAAADMGFCVRKKQAAAVVAQPSAALLAEMARACCALECAAVTLVELTPGLAVPQVPDPDGTVTDCIAADFKYRAQLVAGFSPALAASYNLLQMQLGCCQHLFGRSLSPQVVRFDATLANGAIIGGDVSSVISALAKHFQLIAGLARPESLDRRQFIGQAAGRKEQS
jgi:hypothetical protein